MNRSLASLTATAAVVIGLVAAAPTVAAAPADATPHPVAALIKNHTITVAEWIDVRRAIRSEAERARDAKRTTALAPLVSAGTITQDEADTIVNAPGRIGLRQLVLHRELDRTQAASIRAALRNRETISRDVVIDAALADLVSDGTLTQAQADAVDAAITARRAAYAPEPAPQPATGTSSVSPAPSTTS